MSCGSKIRGAARSRAAFVPKRVACYLNPATRYLHCREKTYAKRQAQGEEAHGEGKPPSAKHSGEQC